MSWISNQEAKQTERLKFVSGYDQPASFVMCSHGECGGIK